LTSINQTSPTPQPEHDQDGVEITGGLDVFEHLVLEIRIKLAVAVAILQIHEPHLADRKIQHVDTEEFDLIRRGFSRGGFPLKHQEIRSAQIVLHHVEFRDTEAE
jgi:hypothetical protein